MLILLGGSMRYGIGFFMLVVMAGCKAVPPKPPQPVGDYRPINKAVEALPAVMPRPGAFGIGE